MIFHYLEIGPLKEREYTGISYVTAALASQMLNDTQNNCFFFFGRTIIDRSVVADLLECRDGELLEWYTSSCVGRQAPFNAPGTHAAIFPNRKTCRRAFDFEAQIIHDLSTLLTPQYHHQDTIDFHANTLEGDIATNDLTVCVSDATRTDVVRYLTPADPSSVVTIYNAAMASDDASDDYDLPRKPYILILGTIEPRKNIGQVLALLRESPAFAERFQFVVIGRYGWGTTIGDLIAEYNLQHLVESGALSFPGYVNEAVKNSLIRNARLLIYPSLFEGFGLPILEAMSLGVPCITTFSSSMPEVGGDACFYFDPSKPGDFRKALVGALIKIDQDRTGLGRRCMEQAKVFSWDESYRKLLAEISSRTSG